MDGPYTVGYGKPPKKNQFKKGKSGNPLGRRIKRRLKGGPKAPLCFEKVLIAELKSLITATDAGGRKKKISRLEAFAKSLVAHALKGDKAAMRYLLAQLPKLPHDAFVEDGDGIYMFRYNEEQRKAMESFIKEVGDYEIPEEDQDTGLSSSS